MFIPKQFEWKEPKEIIDFIKAHPFGILFNTIQNKPIATHIPFLIKEHKLYAHMARNNQQWQGSSEVLAVFSGPHAYISPTLYNTSNNVPTWNYVAVHISGCLKVLDADASGKVIHDTIQEFEPKFLQQIPKIDAAYLKGLYTELVAFEIEITQIEAVKKLSQDKSDEERLNIKEELINQHSNLSDWIK